VQVSEAVQGSTKRPGKGACNLPGERIAEHGAGIVLIIACNLPGERIVEHGADILLIIAWT